MRHNASNTAALPRVCYRRIRGTRAEKLAALDHVGPPDFGDEAQAWQTLPDRAGDSPLLPSSGAADWQDLPALIDLFPWQQPGCMFNRTWPIAPDQQTLQRRWSRFTAAAVPGERAAAFATAKTGRSIQTQVAGPARLVDLRSGSQHRPIVHYGFRSFDRQWTFDDPRLVNLDRPSLWQSRSERQLFFSTLTTTPLGAGIARRVRGAGRTGIVLGTSDRFGAVPGGRTRPGAHELLPQEAIAQSFHEQYRQIARWATEERA